MGTVPPALWGGLVGRGSSRIQNRHQAETDRRGAGAVPSLGGGLRGLPVSIAATAVLLLRHGACM